MNGVFCLVSAIKMQPDQLVQFAHFLAEFYLDRFQGVSPRM
jgi:hypothetical protein